MSGAQYYDLTSASEDEYSEEEDEGGPDVLRVPESSRPSHKVITKESLLAAQSEDLRKVQDVLGLSQTHARTLLIHHRWDVEGLFAKLADQGEHRLFSNAGLPPRNSSSRRLVVKWGIQCGICVEEVAQGDATAMDCGHIFCNECWTQYFSMKIKEGQCRRLTCMEHKCGAICDEEKVRALVGRNDPECEDRYVRFLLESYIEDNAKVKWCPSVPHCGSAIKVEGEPYCEIECTCREQFCFNCLAEPHSPCSCQIWQLWDKTCKSEYPNVKWITVNTKSCPRCLKPVEKNGGCNVVTCICLQQFCWMCGDKRGYAHHDCGRYRAERETDVARKQSELQRYVHYHTRWKGHLDSLKAEQNQRNILQLKLSYLDERDTTVKDYSWLTSGLQKLFRVRRALSYSYAFAYFMFGNELFKDEISYKQNEINQNLFEDQQTRLEATVEQLSKLVETPLEVDAADHLEVNGLRMKVVNLTALTDLLCERMYDVIENDLLGSLQLSTHHTAPYISNGAERASCIEADTYGEDSLHSSPSTMGHVLGRGKKQRSS